MDDHVNFEDLNVEFGFSCMPDRLYYFSKEENEFRMELRQWCEENVGPEENLGRITLNSIQDLCQDLNERDIFTCC